VNRTKAAHSSKEATSFRAGVEMKEGICRSRGFSDYLLRVTKPTNDSIHRLSNIHDMGPPTSGALLSTRYTAATSDPPMQRRDFVRRSLATAFGALAAGCGVRQQQEVPIPMTCSRPPGESPLITTMSSRAGIRHFERSTTPADKRVRRRARGWSCLSSINRCCRNRSGSWHCHCRNSQE